MTHPNPQPIPQPSQNPQPSQTSNQTPTPTTPVSGEEPTQSANEGDRGSGGGGIFEGIADAITEALAPLKAIQKLMDLISGAWLATKIVRGVCFIGGSFFILLAAVLLGREFKKEV